MNQNKNFQLLAVFFFTSLACFAQSNLVEYTIEGRIQGLSSGKIYFSVFGGPSPKADSAEIKNGAFHFKGSLQEPSPVILSLERNYVNKPLFTFFIDKGKHKVELIKDDLNKGSVKGSSATAEYELLKSIEEPFNNKFASLRQLAKDSSEAAQAEWEKMRSSTFRDKQAAQVAFIKAHPASPVAAWATHRNFSYDPSKEKLFKELYEILSPSLHYTSYAAAMKEILEKLEILSIGNIAPDFTQNDTLDKPVSLKDFRGQYVLVDFWASWCAPCRKDNPNVVKAFNRFNEKGFTVLGVSLDRPGKKEAWLKAIHDDGLKWTHVSDLKFWDNEVARQYGVKAVPTNLLIGPDGKILAKNLHDGELEKTLDHFIR